MRPIWGAALTDGVHEQVEGLDLWTAARPASVVRGSISFTAYSTSWVLIGTYRLPPAALGRFHLDLLSPRHLEPCQNRQVIRTADSDLLIQTTLVEQA